MIREITLLRRLKIKTVRADKLIHLSGSLIFGRGVIVVDMIFLMKLHCREMTSFIGGELMKTNELPHMI
jgi:hypothetical protein